MAALTYAGGALGLTFAGDLLSLFLFSELMAVSAALLVWLRRQPESTAAGFRYLLVHLFAGLCLLGGTVLLWSQTGSLAFGNMSPYAGSPAYTLILLAFLVNAAVPPFGAWLPDAYPEATVTGAVFLTAFTTKVGSPLDDYGRNIYVDTLDSRYGKGWRRENAFLAHRPTGVFCYGFYPFTSRGPGNGSKYRLTVVGPGVTPDVSVVIPGLHDFNRNSPGDVAYESQQNARQDSVAAGDKKCKAH